MFNFFKTSFSMNKVGILLFFEFLAIE